MSKNGENTHIIPYRTFIIVLLALLAFTFISIGVTSYELGPFTVVAALLLATCKTILILTYFMHLKYDVRMFAILITAVLVLIGVVMFITFLDFSAFIDSLCPDSREKSLAITKIEESVMWANAAIARRE